MKPAACPECDRALRRVVHKHFAHDCADCQIRRLAYLRGDELTEELDAIRLKDGVIGCARIYERVKLEKARIAALSAAMPRREKV